MLIDAAIDGQGIALARTALAALDLIHGRLVRPVVLQDRHAVEWMQRKALGRTHIGFEIVEGVGHLLTHRATRTHLPFSKSL